MTRIFGYDAANSDPTLTKALSRRPLIAAAFVDVVSPRSIKDER